MNITARRVEFSIDISSLTTEVNQTIFDALTEASISLVFEAILKQDKEKASEFLLEYKAYKARHVQSNLPVVSALNVLGTPND